MSRTPCTVSIRSAISFGCGIVAAERPPCECFLQDHLLPHELVKLAATSDPEAASSLLVHRSPAARRMCEFSLPFLQASRATRCARLRRRAPRGPATGWTPNAAARASATPLLRRQPSPPPAACRRTPEKPERLDDIQHALNTSGDGDASTSASAIAHASRREGN